MGGSLGVLPIASNSPAEGLGQGERRCFVSPGVGSAKTGDLTDVSSPPPVQYGIVLDAGSSHTAMFVYKWPSNKENETGIVSQHSDCHVKGGGISSYFDKPPAAGESLVLCLDQALKDVPKARHGITPLYLGATAGMRLLKKSWEEIKWGCVGWRMRAAALSKAETQPGRFFLPLQLLKKGPKLEPFLQNYCSMATFVSLLLTRGYHFNNSTFPSIAFQKKIGDTTVGWALGYMLNLTNMIPAEEPGFRKGTPFGPWVGLIFLFVAILLGSLVSIFCLLKSSKDRGGV
ncbi:PREDICTED: ectonucleoside triphosphate diphosphohydrolase 2 [Thamnophis sirtalis]|uniref:Ectonucleoside triphosphate diphosphohydrolase 2 n=1 Tax=Thamnophis sirtalis TaxID=35019 RepID=A0A6I9XIF4_9SAUR|nr:PREDICTED: ectonucleoside triphosphate diphosphohydrolase 2 [Thamnophis sirtalis]